MEQNIEIIVDFALQFGVGLIFVLFGRRLFWILGAFVFATSAIVLLGALLDPNALDMLAQGSMQFDLGLESVGEPTQSQLQIALLLVFWFIVSALAGVICSLRFPRAASAVVGFSTGAFFLVIILHLFAFELPEPVRRTLVIVAGAIIAVIAINHPAETMIILSVMLGSKMLVDAFKLDLNSPLSAYMWLITMLVGIVYQTSVWRRGERKKTGQPTSPAPAPSKL